jgi:amidase
MPGRRSPSSSTAPWGLDAVELAELLRGRRVGAVEVLDAYLARIGAENPRLNAVIHIDADGAYAAARKADARSRPLGPLHGMPMTLKDSHRVRGMPTVVGNPAAPRRPAQADGAVAARLRAAGAVIFGKTNVAKDLGDFGSDNPVFGQTVNPVAEGRTPGGSSGGAAAALAARLTPLEVGSDLAGSVRIPAAFCGIFGLKPSTTAISTAGHITQPALHSRGGGVNALVAVGPMARTAQDVELLFDVLTGIPGSRRRRDVGHPRLGTLRTLGEVPIQRDVEDALETVSSAASRAGGRVTSVASPVPPHELHAQWVAVHGAASEHGRSWRAARPLVARQRDAMRRTWLAWMRGFDAILMPVAMRTAFAHQPAGGLIDVDGQPVRYWLLARLTEPANLFDLPAIVFPAGHDGDGMPIGLQLIGPPGSERRLIHLAGWLSELGGRSR